MDAYTELRQRARSKRDETIRDANSLYKQAIKRIDQPERQLGRAMPMQAVVSEPDAQGIMELMLANMPKARVWGSSTP
jgi:hypothetical protein